MSTGSDVETVTGAHVISKSVGGLRDRIRSGGRSVTTGINRATWALAKVRELPERFKQLEAEVAETQRLHQRVAELTDVVAEVLVPAADRDDARIQAALAKYHDTSF